MDIRELNLDAAGLWLICDPADDSETKARHPFNAA
jgi:hypothetical protein